MATIKVEEKALVKQAIPSFKSASAFVNDQKVVTQSVKPRVVTDWENFTFNTTCVLFSSSKVHTIAVPANIDYSNMGQMKTHFKKHVIDVMEQLTSGFLKMKYDEITGNKIFDWIVSIEGQSLPVALITLRSDKELPFDDLNDGQTMLDYYNKTPAFANNIDQLWNEMKERKILHGVLSTGEHTCFVRALLSGTDIVFSTRPIKQNSKNPYFFEAFMLFSYSSKYIRDESYTDIPENVMNSYNTTLRTYGLSFNQLKG